MSRNAKGHRGVTVVIGEREAALVELEVCEHVGCPAIAAAKQPPLAHHGIARRLVGLSPRYSEPMGRAGAKEICNFARFARPQIDHAASRRMPRGSPGEIDVHVVFIRHVRSKDLEDVDLGRGRCARLGFTLLIGLERTLVRVRARVHRRDVLDDGVGKHHSAVASRKISTVQALAEEERVFKREVVVRGVQLVEVPAVARQDQRDASNAELSARRCHPERGVGAAEQELRAWRWRPGGRAPRPRACGWNGECRERGDDGERAANRGAKA